MKILEVKDFTGLTISDAYRQGLQELYPNVHTWVSQSEACSIEDGKFKITWGGKIGSSRPNLHVFLAEPNTLTEGIQDFWGICKYRFPSSFVVSSWFVFNEFLSELSSDGSTHSLTSQMAVSYTHLTLPTTPYV